MTAAPSPAIIDSVAICAICEQPILTTREAGAVGSEVVHKACVRMMTASSTVLTRTKKKLMEVEIAALTERNILNGKIMDLRNENRELRAQLGQLRVRIDDKIDALTMKDLSILRLQSEIRSLADMNAQYSTKFTELERERDAARREAALHRAIGTPVITSIGTPGTVDDRDPAEVRFGLLELDKPK
jgi:predicted RNase H-like nuclease (RuvC/YqgF family)